MSGIKGVDYVDKYGNIVLTGGKLTAQKNLAKDPDYYRKLGSLGGKAPTTKPKGFAADIERARIAGRKSGEISKKGLKFIKEYKGVRTYIARDTGKVVEYIYDSISKEYKRNN